jgi:hypothetical protein
VAASVINPRLKLKAYILKQEKSCCLRAFGQFVSLLAKDLPQSITNVLTGNDTEKISMAPALRMTRSIKEKLPIFCCFAFCFYFPSLAIRGRHISHLPIEVSVGCSVFLLVFAFFFWLPRCAKRVLARVLLQLGSRRDDRVNYQPRRLKPCAR